MEIKKRITTKYGVVDALFEFDCGVWVGSARTGKVSAIVQEHDLNKAIDELIVSYECMIEFNEELENNPHKNKVSTEALDKLMTGLNFWNNYKN